MAANLQAVRPASLDTLRDQIAPKASDDELRYLGAVAQRLGLDPIAGHIVLIGRFDSRLSREVHRPQVTADGRLVLAERTGQYHGYDGPEWCGPRNKTGGHDWVDVWDDDDPPHAARVIVHRSGWRPTNGTVRWAEFAQKQKSGQLAPTWQQMPAHMLAKVALSLALRRAFPGVVPVDADLDDDLADVERRSDDAPAPDVAGRRPLLLVDATHRQSLLQAAEGLRLADPRAANWLLRESEYFGLPKLSGGDPMNRGEGELWRRLLADAPFAVGDSRPELSPDAWTPMPDDIHDDAPESTGSVDADQPTSYDAEGP